MTGNRPPHVRRTPLQLDADRLDCDLYRLYCRVERLWEDNPRVQEQLRNTLAGLRAARTPLRMLMHEQDRKETT